MNCQSKIKINVFIWCSWILLQWPLSWLQVSSHVFHLSSMVSCAVGMTKEAFLTNTHSLNYTCTQTHTLTDLPLIVQVKLCIFICGLEKKTKQKQVTFLIGQQEQCKCTKHKRTHNRQQHPTVAASRGQACDSCGSEGNNREEVWKALHFSVFLIVMRPISQRMSSYICKWGQLVPDLNPCPIWFC